MIVNGVEETRDERRETRDKSNVTCPRGRGAC